MEDADKSEHDKKTYLIGIINEVTTIMAKPDDKELNTPTSSEQKEDTDPYERVKENTKVVNNGNKESDVQAGKAVADDDQEGEDKMNILRELGVLKKNFGYRGVLGRRDRKKNSRMCPLCAR